MKTIVALFLSFLFLAGSTFAAEKAKPEKKEDDQSKLKTETFSGLELRNIGPASTSGRVGDIAVDGKHPGIYYVASASGGVWKTINWGTTWTPIFDSEGSYSIGCIVIDPNDPLTVWVGSGENNSQRSVSYGDGVYRSLDGGTSWENMGLKDSQHIAKILIDPRNSKVVYVAAQGPLWGPGGDRGLYKTTDGGKTWAQSLKISENTGVTDAVFDPRNPDVIYAAAYQRRRHVWTLIDGGPESAIYKTVDAGANWKKIENGLPKEEMGRIGLAISPAKPDTVYAIIEAANKAGGFFRSTDSGANWEKRGDYMSSSPQYYNEIYADPINADRVYAMDTWINITQDGGKSFNRLGEKYKHVDNHVIWIDPDNTNHLLSGCDGGLYETFDRAATWNYKSNLPITQFYNVSVDTSQPFYTVCGGTQDNSTLCGPSRTVTNHGIMNSEWFTCVGGDGFQSQIDPEDPNLIYCEAQYGALVRFDKKTGEKLDIQPQPGKGEPALRFNWNSPVIISPHSHTRLYFAANILFRSDDRGDTWKAVSPDLTRQIDRNNLKVMGRIWGVDSVAKNASTSFFGNIVSLAESPVKDGVLFVGTDDGLIQISEDGGTTWRKIEHFPGVPDQTYVSYISPSKTDANTLFASFDNHNMGDFKPYLLKSTDLGKSWTSIAGNLPARGGVNTVTQDFVTPELLFAGTEFGLFFTVDGGKKWIQLKGGMPIISVKDLVIQKRENDLVIATFGRGFYILDDFSALRTISESTLGQEAVLFPVKPAWMYIQQNPLDLQGKSFQGDSFFTAENPPFGATFTYYLKDEFKTKKKSRQEGEKKLIKEDKDVVYPAWQALDAEASEEGPALLLTIKDEAGNVVRRLTGPVTAGFHRVAWDLRYPAPDPSQLTPPSDDNPFQSPPIGPLAVPGTYEVSLSKRIEGKIVSIGQPQKFTTAPLGSASLPAPDRKKLEDFEQKTARLQRAVLGSIQVVQDTQQRLKLLSKALDDTPAAAPELADQARSLTQRLNEINTILTGDSAQRRYNEATPPSLSERIQIIISGHWTATTAPTQTHMQGYEIAADEFTSVLEKLRALVQVDLKALEDKAEVAGAPWTPGRFPEWKKE